METGAVPAPPVSVFDNRVHQQLGLRAGHEHPGVDVKVEPVEFPAPHDVGEGLAAGPPPEQHAHSRGRVLVDRVAQRREEAGAVPAQDVPQKHLRLDPGVVHRTVEAVRGGYPALPQVHSPATWSIRFCS